jgi:hypothetical protein
MIACYFRKFKNDKKKWSPRQIICPMKSLLEVVMLLCIMLLVFQFLYFSGHATNGCNSMDVKNWLLHNGDRYSISPSNQEAAIKEDRPLPFSFAACLLIKDSNIILPEWLAYHYTILPLRRLIVAIDPTSHTDPTPILNRYKTIGMNITIWTNDEPYWIDQNGKGIGKNNIVITNEKELQDRHLTRQKKFLKKCLSQLHYEQRTWTILIDVDEYLAFNYYDEHEGAPTFCHQNRTCEAEYVKSIRDGSHIRTKLSRSPKATVAEHIYKHIDGLFESTNNNKPCIIFGRYLFVSSKESDQIEIQKGVAYPESFNASYFHTLRYLHRAPLATYQLGKSLVDVSRFNDSMDIFNIHRPLRDLCTGHNAYVHNAGMSFRVHHYVGSWESFRRTGLDFRGRKKFDERNRVTNVVFDRTTTRYFEEDDASNSSSSSTYTWLTQFTKLVGKDKALELTQQIRIREELETEKNFNEVVAGTRQ